VNSKFYNLALVLFFALNSLIWIPWGFICLFIPEAWSGQVIPGMTVFDLSHAVARTEVRAMYGGLQIAISLLALIAIFKPRHRETALLFYVMALSGLALSRMYGLVTEGSSEIIRFGITVTADNYNQVGLGMYELRHFLLVCILF
jgi:Domain of unknown function (DUF4345)